MTMRFLLSMFLTLAVFAAHQAYAQSATVQVRTGAHAEYSRLVFDWDIKPDFEVSKGGNTLTIAFKQAANFNLAQVKADPVANILSVEALSQNPASVKVTIPENARHRSFYAGTKMVLDVYNPPGATPAKPKEVAKAEPEPKPEPAKEPEAVEAEPPQIPADTETITAGQKPAATVAPVEEESLDPSTAKAVTGSNLITVSSSSSVGLAVFERGDELWIVDDQVNTSAVAPISAQVSGPNAEYFLPLKKIALAGGEAFITKAAPRNFIRTQGGGLLWKIIISPQKSNDKPVEPVRQNASDTKPRSGRVLWPFKEPGQVIDVTDPITGQPLKVVTVKSSKDFAGPGRSFIDFDVLPATAGLVIAPKVDDLQIRIISTGVEISRPEGLAILSQDRIKENTPNLLNRQPTDKQSPRIFDFQNWQLGGIDALDDNQTIILSEIKKLPKNAQDDDLMTLAKTALSNAMGAEALGFLEIIEDNSADISKTPEFRAIRGAARAIDYKTETAFNDLSIKELEKYEEIGFWKAYALADLGDWRQAIETLPASAAVLQDYPDLLQTRVGLVAAEVALRAGNTDLASDILGMIAKHEKTLNPPQLAALNYLKGETARQTGNIEETKKYWEPLTTGPDDLYRAKAGLALTRLLVDQKELTIGKAIDSLERLRYAWRGDELEAQINYWLGRTYFEGRQFVKGLNIMREAASVAAGTNLGERITSEMSDAFTNLFLTDALDKVTPLEAMALYEQFTELVPAGDPGNKIVERLADRLTQADILDKASELLTYQLAHRLDGEAAYNVGIKLAAINLIDRKPKEAIAALDRAKEKLEQWPPEAQTREKKQAIALLRARALSLQGRPDQAIALLGDLEPNRAINRLRADIAWRAGYWDDAAIALEDVILDENMSLTRPLSEDNSALILQRTIALNLAGDRIGLANMREKYADAMAQTKKARLFEVITRPRQNAALADRETLMGIVSEVDLFSDFLNSYKDVSLSTSN